MKPALSLNLGSEGSSGLSSDPQEIMAQAKWQPMGRVGIKTLTVMAAVVSEANQILSRSSLNKKC